jgi:hypothetical protein
MLAKRGSSPRVSKGVHLRAMGRALIADALPYGWATAPWRDSFTNTRPLFFRFRISEETLTATSIEEAKLKDLLKSVVAEVFGRTPRVR